MSVVHYWQVGTTSTSSQLDYVRNRTTWKSSLPHLELKGRAFLRQFVYAMA
jgi:hypothetical protein